MDKRTKFQKLILREFADANYRITCRRNGIVEIRCAYLFFQPAGGVIAFGQKIQTELPAGRVMRVVDEPGKYPTPSYLCAVVSEV